MNFFAIFTVSNAMLVIRGVKSDQLTKVISLFSFMRMLFIGFGVVLAVTLWILREAFCQTRLTAKAWTLALANIYFLYARIFIGLFFVVFFYESN